MKVIAALSGGVDSSAALKMALDQGHEVIGVTLSLWDYSDPAKFGSCCASRDVMDARRVCDQMSVPFYVLDAGKEFRAKVVNNFIEEFENQRTPSPCIRCNSYVKFQRLAQTAKEMGAGRIITGHYAQIHRTENELTIKKGADPDKDQSYFLFALEPEILAMLDMPLGGYTKPQVREMASDWNLTVAKKPDSQELCFLGSDKPAQFLKEHGTPGYIPRAELYDAVTGNFLGFHETGVFLTMGQRRGTILAKGERQYVVRIEGQKVYLGPEELLYSDEVRIASSVWHLDPTGRNLSVKLRSRHEGSPVLEVIRDENGKAVIKLATKERAITPGQAAVLYDGDLVVGGGWII